MTQATLDMVDKRELYAASNDAFFAMAALRRAIEENDYIKAQVALADLEEALDRARAALPDPAVPR